MNVKLMKQNSKQNSLIIEAMQGIEVIKSLTREDFFIGKLTHSYKEFTDTSRNYASKVSFQQTIQSFIHNIYQLLVYLIGTYLIIERHWSVGQLMFFLSLLTYFLDPIERLVQIQDKFMGAVVAANRVSEFFEMPNEYKSDKKILKLSDKKNKELRLQGLFYVVNDKVLFSDINYTFYSGMYGITGESGVGKTTLGKIISGLLDDYKGNVFLNGFDIQSIDRKTLRNTILYVGQEPIFFSGTILENLSLGRDIKKDKVIELCQAVSMHEIIMNLPKKYDTFLEENAKNLSTGQKQRLMLVRAVLTRPNFLILDETTSNLDHFSEEKILLLLSKLKKNTSILFITHKKDTLRNCDQVLLLENNSIKMMKK